MQLWVVGGANPSSQETIEVGWDKNPAGYTKHRAELADGRERHVDAVRR